MVTGFSPSHFIQKDLRNNIIKYSSGFMRIWNEVSTIALFTIVFLVTLKNSINWIYSIISLICFIIIIAVFIKLYKKIRENNDKEI